MAMCVALSFRIHRICDGHATSSLCLQGMVSFNEFLTWYTDDGMVNNLIKTYDTDGNGKLNLDEFTEMCRQWDLDPAKVR